MAGRHSRLLRGVLDLAVLRVLADEDRYGYQIAQALERAGLDRLKGGTLYPLLRRLEEAGHVVSSWREGEHGPNRRYYALTGAGRAFLADGSAEFEAFATRALALLSPGGAR